MVSQTSPLILSSHASTLKYLTMEKDKFDNLVDSLLQPVLKSEVAKMARYRTADVIRREGSVRLAPKPNLKPCEDCDELVSNRVIYISVKLLNTPYPYWEKKCSECGQKDRIKNKKKEVKKPCIDKNAKYT